MLKISKKISFLDLFVISAEIPLRVFFHKDFKSLLYYQSFREYVYSLPEYKQAGQKFNEDVVKDLTLKLDSMLKDPSKGPKWNGPFFGKKKPKFKTSRKREKAKRRKPKKAKGFTGQKVSSCNRIFIIDWRLTVKFPNLKILKSLYYQLNNL